ncbi:hypothetical protein CY34DRAFT_110419 [Suillus luteus UH-Slu-Lm8-n1]|uniref:Uncharacterized protein n=1 Tax=Suillus luteus UH-Slu-Lm8-n1 TaxID=930992 RepID=A0A0C9ZXE2_9AGAM|nr:hypothetical protein CY34DRAFT_110419 [Suillus luteus UH-Slu-Lm8-n1]
MEGRDYVAKKDAPWELAVLCTVGVTSVRNYHLTSNEDWRGPTAAAKHISEAVAWCIMDLPHNVPFVWDNEVTMKNLKFLQERGAEGKDMDQEGFLDEEKREKMKFQHRFMKQGLNGLEDISIGQWPMHTLTIYFMLGHTMVDKLNTYLAEMVMIRVLALPSNFGDGSSSMYTPMERHKGPFHI